MHNYNYDYLQGIQYVGDQVSYNAKNNNMVRYQYLWDDLRYSPQYDIDYSDPAFTSFYDEEEDDNNGTTLIANLVKINNPIIQLDLID